MSVNGAQLLAELRKRQEQPPVVSGSQLLGLLRQAKQEVATGGKPFQQQAAETVGRELRGVGDAALTAVTGLAGQVVGGLHGAYDLLTGKGVSKAGEDIHNTSQAMTWTPRTPEGQRDLEGVGKAFDYGKRGAEAAVAGNLLPFMGAPDMQTAREVFQKGAGDTVLERTGSPALATLANMGVDIALLAPQLAGLRGASATAMPRTSLTGVEKQALKALETDVTPEVGSQFRSGATKREAQINMLRDAEQKAAQLGPDATFTDVGGANSRALAAAHGATSSTGKQLRSQIADRQVGVRDRMVNFLNDKLFKGRTLEKATAEIDETMRSSAAPLYREAWSHDVVLTPELKASLSEPVVADAIPEALRMLKAEPTITAAEAAAGKRGLTVQQKAKAKRMFKVDRQAVEGSPGIRKQAELGADSTGSARRGININRLDSVGLDFLKRGMDTLTSRAAKIEARAQEAGALGIQTRNLRKAIEAQNPTYGEALSVWSTGKDALDAAASGGLAFRQLANGTKSAEALIDEFNALNKSEQALYRIGAADYLRSKIRTKPDLKSGETPSSVYTTFAGSPAHRDLLKTIFENEGDFGAFNKLMSRENTFSDTLKATNVGDATEVLMQNAYSSGRFAEQLARMSTDALYAASGNRYAMLGLIQNAIVHPGQFLRSFQSAEAARLSLGNNAQATIREMLNVLEAKRAVNGPAVNGMMKKMWRITKMPPRKMYNWLKDEKHRRQLYALGTAAVVAEQHGAESNGK